MNTPIKFAVIGCGHIGKRHAEMIQRHPESELVAICDPRSRDEVGANAFDVPYFQDARAMLDQVEDIDVVNVCTPNGLHAELSLLALERRKHVVCEKPLALSKANCEAIIYKALQVHRTVFGVMQNRYSPPSQWIKGVVDQGLLGNIHLVQVNCYWNRDERYYKKGSWKGTKDLDGGTLFTQFSHFIDILYWLFGDISDIQGKFADFNHQDLTEFEDSGLVNFRFLNGGMGCLNYSTAVWDKNLESSMTIIGSTGSVKIGGQYMDQVEYCHIKDYTMPVLAPTNPANDYGTYKGSANNHGFIIDNVVDTLNGRNTLTTNALEGLKVVEIIERIYKKRNEQSV
ncbi:MAG TPA: Gfo/Idh/MocA family oxidoreductase [Flavobacteriales bacterium]|jgi:UDP-N-acetyl-2-amino-2-deoxyglucuronate dehydrogenase|nr:Gfo/Idh/MocA family oxidoreductase [Flavobacteriales bacterium]MBK7102105.1 Gfo/Idh/MocA family oxidoreductase [Flavobacteriales bacterium]MBK7112576.1 Gfo/Idh/MocA family oxidoreductase [Flavobacteriales bacterium]MBK7620414.1 Gfo/Idh/MocA family oxidoreductase [Flavobacteriales bacterium]MBK8531502.1 Gfo/Idh/MocA family oxidoreductase [Flavobacteriales bacterium]